MPSAIPRRCAHGRACGLHGGCNGVVSKHHRPEVKARSKAWRPHGATHTCGAGQRCGQLRHPHLRQVARAADRASQLHSQAMRPGHDWQGSGGACCGASCGTPRKGNSESGLQLCQPQHRRAGMQCRQARLADGDEAAL